MINLFLIIFLFLLLYPKPIKNTLKKILPEVILFGLIIGGYNIYNYWTNDSIIITALNEENSLAEGNEIWINSIEIDDEVYMPSEIFSGNWLNVQGKLGWRNFDNLDLQITANISRDKNIKIFFERNRWRGKVSIKRGGKERIIDCYYNVDNGISDLVYELPKNNINFSILKNKDNLLFGLILIVLLYSFFALYNIKRYPLSSKIIQQRSIWIDLLKITSAFMIVLIHASGNIYNTSTIDTSLWFKAVILNAIPRFAVPCFIMITGILMLSKNYTKSEIYRKKIPRIMIALFFWSVIYILWNNPGDLRKNILSIPFISQSGPLWYGYQLIWLYILYPVTKKIDMSFNIELKRYFLITILGGLGSWDLIKKLVFPMELSNSLSFASITPQLSYIALFLLGKFIVDNYSNFSKVKNILTGLILILLGLGIMIISTLYLDKITNSITHDLFSECRLPAVIYSMGVLRLCLGIKEYLKDIHSLFIDTIIVKISNLSLGIYFLHSLILWMIPEVKLGKTTYSIYNSNISHVIICVIIDFVITIGLVCIISKIPKIKNVVL